MAPRMIEAIRHKGPAMIGQPYPQHQFHRPSSVLPNFFFEAGFAADGIEEPVFDNQPPERPSEPGQLQGDTARHSGPAAASELSRVSGHN